MARAATLVMDVVATAKMAVKCILIRKSNLISEW